MFSLKYFLRKDPEKNIKLANEFLKERPRSSSDMLDYEDQAIITLNVCDMRNYLLFRIILRPRSALASEFGENIQLV